MTLMEEMNSKLDQILLILGQQPTVTAGVTTTPTGPVFAQGTGPLNKDRTCVCRGTGHRLTKQGTAAPCNHCNQ